MKVITIGRSSNNDVVIEDSKVSRHHLQIIQYDNGSFGVADFGSTNGTFVNGRRITGKVLLNPNDIVRIGNTTLLWQDYFPTDSEPPAPDPSPSGIWVFLLGLVSLGLVAYIVINYFTSLGNQLAHMFGGMEGSLKLFPIYLRGYFGVGGQWVLMIAAAILAIVANYIDGVLNEEEQENSLSKAGTRMANFALVVAVIFILLAVFAEQIVKMY